MLPGNQVLIFVCHGYIVVLFFYGDLQSRLYGIWYVALILYVIEVYLLYLINQQSWEKLSLDHAFLITLTSTQHNWILYSTAEI